MDLVESVNPMMYHQIGGGAMSECHQHRIRQFPAYGVQRVVPRCQYAKLTNCRPFWGKRQKLLHHKHQCPGNCSVPVRPWEVHSWDCPLVIYRHLNSSIQFYQVMKGLQCTMQSSNFWFFKHHRDVKLRISMETAVLIIGNSWDGSVLLGDLVLERDQLSACTFSSSLEGKALQEGQPTTTLCNPLLLVPHKRLRSRWRQQLSTAIPGHCPLPGLAFVSCHAPQEWNRMVCPMQTKGFSSHGHLPTIPGVRHITAWPRGRSEKWLYPSDVSWCTLLPGK